MFAAPGVCLRCSLPLSWLRHEGLAKLPAKQQEWRSRLRHKHQAVQYSAPLFAAVQLGDPEWALQSCWISYAPSIKCTTLKPTNVRSQQVKVCTADLRTAE